jgi:hypothetical protein
VNPGPCNGLTTFTAPSGTISDGSEGANYSSNQNCQFLIQPADVSTITISFTSFETETQYDYVNVYDGNSTSATLLGTYSGSSFPSDITSTGPVLFLEFVTDNAITKRGWSLNYTSSVSSNNTLCSGLTSYTASSGTLTDGSGLYNYSNNMNCRFLIQPPGATLVTLHFISYNTESNNDFVNVYNGVSTSSPIIGVFSGATLPADIDANSGTMLIEFTSNASNTRQGWHATYTSSTLTETEHEKQNGKIFIYPNPANKEITIKGLRSSFTEIKALNILGEIIYDQKISTTSEHIMDIVNWPQGVYYLVVYAEDREILIEKFIKY